MRIVRATPRKIEVGQQILFIEWATWFVLYDGEPLVNWIWHTPNGGKRHVAVARELKKMGTKAGVPDLTCAIPTRLFHGFYGEMKSKDGVLSTDQTSVRNRLRVAGYFVAVEKSAKAMQDTLLGYLAEARGKTVVKARIPG